MMTYYVLRAGSVVGRVLPLAVLYAVATIGARAAYLLPTRARSAVRANIARVMGCAPNSKAVRRAAANAFRCQALNYIDLMRLDRITPAELDASVVRGDLKPFTDCVAAGKGVIVVTAHVGNMDYVAQWMSLNGYHVHTVMEDLRPERLFQYVCRKRTGAGLHIHQLDANATGALTDALREGAVVALIADRDLTGSGESVEFFGATTRLAVGPALLALRTGAPLLAAFGRRLRDNRLYVSAQPPITLARTRHLRADLQHGVEVIAELLQDGIARAPDQWIVFEPIWKDGAA